MQLGVGDRRVQRTALDDLGQPVGVDAHSVGQFERLGHALDKDGHIGIDDQLHPAALARLTQPHGLAADRGERRTHDRLRPERAGGQDEQLAGLGRALAARHRSVHEQHVGPELAQSSGDLGRGGHADRAHLRPHRVLGEGGGHPAVEDD